MRLVRNFFKFLATENLHVKTICTHLPICSKTLTINTIAPFMRNVLPLYHFIWINKHWAFAELYADALQVSVGDKTSQYLTVHINSKRVCYFVACEQQTYFLRKNDRKYVCCSQASYFEILTILIWKVVLREI